MEKIREEKGYVFMEGLESTIVPRTWIKPSPEFNTPPAPVIECGQRVPLIPECNTIRKNPKGYLLISK